MIPDEAVEAALAEWPRWPRPVEEVRRMLEAAAPHLLAQGWDEGYRSGVREESPGWTKNPYTKEQK